MGNGNYFVVFILLVLFSFCNLKAQERTISGKITDDSGPLSGVSIIIEGATSGTESDFDGNYTLDVNIGDVLRFSFVGMTIVTRIVGTKVFINVFLHH